MTIRLGVVMDPIQNINIKKDSTLAILLAAAARGWEIYYMESSDIFLKDGTAYAQMRLITVKDDPNQWFEFKNAVTQPLTYLACILMRKDPPFTIDYIYTTYLLEMAEKAGALILNKPQSLRDANEKLFTAWFPQCCPPSLVTSRPELLHQFLQEHHDIIVKPLGSMGGESIFRITKNDPNKNVVFEIMTRKGQQLMLAQTYLPAILQGDKRIIMINGEPVPYALARIPPEGETRANLAVGGKGIGVALTERDRWICQQVGPTLREKGLILVGLDVIGDYLTEINVTSPTGLRELDKEFHLNIGDLLITYIYKNLSTTPN